MAETGWSLKSPRDVAWMWHARWNAFVIQEDHAKKHIGVA